MTAQTQEPTAPVAATDTRPLLARAFDQAEHLIAGTEATDRALPTPCDEWDVATLSAHMVAVVHRIAGMLGGADPMSLPRFVESDDPAAAWAAERATTDEVLGHDDVLGRTVTAPWGTVDGWQAIGSWAVELSTHAWDLAVATGRAGDLDESLAAAVRPIAQGYLPPVRPEGVAFGPVVETGPDASAYDRLVAWQGRDPGWRPA